MWGSRCQGIRDWRAVAIAKKIAHSTMLRQLAKGNKKKLTRSEERCIFVASYNTK